MELTAELTADGTAVAMVAVEREVARAVAAAAAVEGAVMEAAATEEAALAHQVVVEWAAEAAEARMAVEAACSADHLVYSRCAVACSRTRPRLSPRCGSRHPHQAVAQLECPDHLRGDCSTDRPAATAWYQTAEESKHPD